MRVQRLGKTWRLGNGPRLGIGPKCKPARGPARGPAALRFTPRGARGVVRPVAQ